MPHDKVMVRGGRVYEAVLRRRHGGDVRAALASSSSSSSSHPDLIEHYRPLSDALIVDSLLASRYSIYLLYSYKRVGILTQKALLARWLISTYRT
jgi:hypothetical protein